MATNEAKGGLGWTSDFGWDDPNPNARAMKDTNKPKISAKRAKATCSDEVFLDELDGEGHWYGAPDCYRQEK